ncbi:MAG: hypothetical protein Kow0037_22260 [Calditrichia bacterium]
MAFFISPDSLEIQNLISPNHQLGEDWVDLTLKAVFRVKAAARLDFSGKEFSKPACEPCLPVKQEPEDDYGWWELHEGYYLLKFNEVIPPAESVHLILQPHPHLLESGCHHPTLVLRELSADFRCPIWIPKIGLHLKQNARISRIFVTK